jgi:uncharacterized protein
MSDTRTIAGLFQSPQNARACLVLAHGAGAGMTHSFLETFAAEACERGIATVRYQFPFMEEGRKRPDPPSLAHAAVRAAAAEALRLSPNLPLVAGGKSFGGRMTSQAQALSPLPGVKGLVFLGFPLHAAGRPARTRAEHLSAVTIPMLFLQGTRDALADLEQLKPVVEELGDRATLKLFDGADHAFHVPRRTGKTDADVRQEMLDTLVRWIEGLDPPS